MAYVCKAKKAKIAKALKASLRSGWKYTLAVRNHSTIVMTITEAPMDLSRNVAPTQWVENYGEAQRFQKSISQYDLNEKYQGPRLEALQTIFNSLNTDNFDHSDLLVDYFHVGHYVELRLGSERTPFDFYKHIAKEEALVIEAAIGALQVLPGAAHHVGAGTRSRL